MALGANSIKWAALGLALALALGGVASAEIPSWPPATLAEIGQAKRLLQASGYTDIAVLASNDRLVTVSATKGGQKRVVDVDPMTGIILPHVDMPPLAAQLAGVPGPAANPR